MKTIPLVVLAIVGLVGAAPPGTKTAPNLGTKGRLETAGTKTSQVASPVAGTKTSQIVSPPAATSPIVSPVAGTKTSPIVSPPAVASPIESQDPDLATNTRFDEVKTDDDDFDIEETRSVYGPWMAGSNLRTVAGPYDSNKFADPLPLPSRSVIQTPVDQPLVNPSTIIPKPIVADPIVPKHIFNPPKPLAIVNNQRSFAGALVQPDYSGGYYGMDSNDYLGGWRSAGVNHPMGWNGPVESVYIGSVMQQFGDRKPLLPWTPAVAASNLQPTYAHEIKPMTRFYQPALQTGFKPMLVSGQRLYAKPTQLSPLALNPITYANQGLTASRLASPLISSAVLRHECLYRHKC